MHERIAQPSAAPAPDIQRHTWLQSLAYHLLPGLAPLGAMLALAPVLQARGLPDLLTLYLGSILGVLPVQLGLLYYLGWRRNGRLSLEGVVLYRERVPAGRMLLWVIGLFLWSGLVVTFLGGWLDRLLLPAFEWMPSLFWPALEHFSALAPGVAWGTWAVGLVGVALLAPFVEELYFRGFLLPRMPVATGLAPLAGATLFALYHFWSPWVALTRILMVAPLGYAVQRNRSVWVGVLTHCLLNMTDSVGLLALLLR